MKKIQLGLIALVTLFTSTSAFSSKTKTNFHYWATGITTFSGSGTHYLVQTTPISCTGAANVACDVTTLIQATDPGTGLQVRRTNVHTVSKRAAF